MKSPRTVRGWFIVAIVFVAIALPVYADAESDALALFYQARNAAISSGLAVGQQISLGTKAIGVLEAVRRGNENAARGSLGAFINEVEALQRAGQFDDETANALISSANALADEL